MDTKGSGATDAGPNEEHERNYEQVRPEIKNGDLLLFRGTSWISRVILRLTGGTYSHVGLFYWWGDRLVVFQSASKGVTVLPASTAVCRYDGQVDWWALDRQRAANLDWAKLFDLAVTQLGADFGLGSMLRLGLRLLWRRVRHGKDLATSSRSMFCSQFVSACFRQAGADLVPEHPDHWTSPADFANSGYFTRRFELYDGSKGAACAGMSVSDLFLPKLARPARGRARPEQPAGESVPSTP